MANKKRITANKDKKTVAKRQLEISSSFKIIKQSLLFLWKYRKFWSLFLLIYFLVDLIFVRGLSSGLNIASLKSEFSSVFSGSSSKVNAGLSVLLLLIGSNSSSSSGGSSSIGFFLFIFTALAIIWSFDKLMNSQKITVKEAIYKGIYPIIPFLLAIFYIALQLVPVTVGALIYSTVKNNGIAVGVVEQIIWLILFILSAFWSLYMISSSLFSPFYIALDHKNPVQAIKTASQSVKGLRLKIMGRLLVMIVSLVLSILVIMVLGILLLGNIANWLFFLISILIIPITISYIYHLYLEIK